MGENLYKLHNEGLIARIYKELQKLSTKTPNHVLYDRAKELNRQFSKEEMQMTNKYLKSD